MVGIVVGGSLAQALSFHIGVILLSWMIAGAGLTLLVRLEGGRTASKSGRILQIQQHSSSILLLAMSVFLVAAMGNWHVGASDGPGAESLGHGAERMLSAAGFPHAAGLWKRISVVLLPAIIALRLGIFPFPFSLRRTARRLDGGPLAVFLALFLPTSLWAISRYYVIFVSHVGSELVVAIAGLGAVSVISGGFWLQTEWKVGPLAGHVAQVYLGLGLIGLALGGQGLLGPHLVHSAVVLAVLTIWGTRTQGELGSTDLSTWAEAYRTVPRLRSMHVLAICAAIPWPGTPAGNVWMTALGSDLLAGIGIGVIALGGVVLTTAGLCRSLSKIVARTSYRL